MQIRSLIKTRKRKRAILLLAFAVCGVAMWVFLGGGRKLSDEEKFRSMIRLRDRGERLHDLRSRYAIGTPLNRSLVNLQQGWVDRSFRLEQELVTSGYLAEFRLTNPNAV